MNRILALTATAWLAAALAAAGPPTLKGVGIDETLDRDAVLAPALERARLTGSDVPVFVRLLVRRADLLSPASPAAADFGRLDARLDLYARKQIPVVLVFVDPPTDAAGIDAWRAPLRALVAHVKGKVRAYQIGDRMEGPARPSPRDYGYLLRFVAVQVRSIDAEALIVQGGVAASDEWASWQEQVYREDVSAHVDFLALPAGPPEDRARADAAIGALEAVAARDNPSVLVGVTGMALPADARQASEQLLGWFLSRLGGRVTFATCAAGADTLSAVLKAAAALKDVLSGEVVALDERASVARADRRRPGRRRHGAAPPPLQQHDVRHLPRLLGARTRRRAARGDAAPGVRGHACRPRCRVDHHAQGGGRRPATTRRRRPRPA